MSRSNNVARQLASRTRPIPKNTRICLSCLLSLRHASTSTATAPSSPPTPIHPQPTSHSSPAPPQTQTQIHRLRASLLLSRPPTITRDLTPFEKAFFLYQRRLNERLAMPFSRYFYYAQDTPGGMAWKRAMRERPTPARDIGRYSAYGRNFRHDELLVGATESEPEVQLEALVKDAEGFLRKEESEFTGEVGAVVGETGMEDEGRVQVDRPQPRVTEADRRGDERSLTRRLQRTLYLLVQREGDEGRWEFPTSWLLSKESLQTAAERIIVQAGGVNMNTWVVGSWPVAHHTLNYMVPHRVYHYSQPGQDGEKSPILLGEKAFFMKARIMAGQVDLEGNQLGLNDYKWLTKEEIQQVIEPGEWNAIKNALVER